MALPAILLSLLVLHPAAEAFQIGKKDMKPITVTRRQSLAAGAGWLATFMPGRTRPAGAGGLVDLNSCNLEALYGTGMDKKMAMKIKAAAPYESLSDVAAKVASLVSDSQAVR